MKKISAVYKITNTITGDFYIGSSKDVKHRWAAHKCQSTWKKYPNYPMYQDMEKQGIDKFVFEILAEVEEGNLKQTEQQFIEKMHPAYNDRKANGRDIERYKESQRKASRKYEKTDKCKKYRKEYDNQLCCFNNETLTLHALSERFRRAGIPHPVLEAKKYLI